MTTDPAPPLIEHEPHWSRSARDATDGVLEARPDLDGAEFAMLVEAAELITAADDLMAEARETGLSTTGSTGQTITSPLVVEARLSRTAAGALLGKLVPPRPVEGSRGGNGRYRARMDGTFAGRSPQVPERWSARPPAKRLDVHERLAGTTALDSLPEVL